MTTINKTTTATDKVFCGTEIAFWADEFHAVEKDGELHGINANEESGYTIMRVKAEKGQPFGMAQTKHVSPDTAEKFCALMLKTATPRVVRVSL